ncbi:MAG: AAA family ATPase, partial [Phycisphaerales bacterium]|nr:AAA family ATPase [Phycisphaerales bacterium]
YVRKHDLPFDNREQNVSVMAIKATGVVTENMGDGRRLRVDWSPLDSPREWYFFTYMKTIWRVLPGEWMPDALIAFAFDDKPQDFHRFQNAPYWRERFGDAAVGKHRFQWTRFYEAIADKLLAFQHDRTPLVDAIDAIIGRIDAISNLQDQFTDGTAGPLKDICPFTVFGIFNRGITEDNRKAIAKELATFLGVQEAVPKTFEGIPVLNNQNSWYFGYEKDRQQDDIDTLWNIFAASLRLAESDDPDARTAFINNFDEATSRRRVAWNLTFGLYWIRPWVFATLDRRSRDWALAFN